MIRLDQPLDSCGFAYNKDSAYFITTVGSISFADLASSTVLKNFNAIENVKLNIKYLNLILFLKNENNQFYMIECENINNKNILFYRGNNK